LGENEEVGSVAKVTAEEDSEIDSHPDEAGESLADDENTQEE
jgi:hypothetical protein